MGREDVTPVLVGMAGGDAEPHAVEALADPAADLDQAQAQRREGRARDAGGAQPPAQRVEQPEGGGVEEEAELVGPEPMAGQAVGEAAGLEVLDPVLARAPV